MNSITACVRIPMGQFGRYLRTGMWEPDDSVEVKFNPWHDPKTGRFTFKGGGSSGGSWQGGGFTGGGGGAFNGGGASGSWGGGGFTGGGGGSTGGGGATSREKWGSDAPAPRGKAAPSTTEASPTAQALRAATSTGGNKPQLQSVERNGYTYQLDASGRTRQVTGILTPSSDISRSRAAQAGAGGSNRLATDDGGHYIAARFNGPTDTFNHFAQDANFNRGEYRVLENGWANDIKRGKQVYVAIVPHYDGSSKRPSVIDVTYTVNGTRRTRSFSNSSKGKSRGK